MIFEICVDSAEGALAAQQAGAQRVELCDNLVEGGTTPSLGMIEITRRSISIDLNVIIRPRGGDFCYTDSEFEIMKRDVEVCRDAGANGVVIGLLLPDGRIDVERCHHLVRLARPMSVTFHRAFDMCRSPEEALETLMELEVDRLLTSGQRLTALEGMDCIARLVKQAGSRIVIMAGGGINFTNISAIVAGTKVSECHFAARKSIESPMTYRNPNCFMGKAYQPDEYSQRITSADAVRQVIDALNSQQAHLTL